METFKVTLWIRKQQIFRKILPMHVFIQNYENYIFLTSVYCLNIKIRVKLYDGKAVWWQSCMMAKLYEGKAVLW